MLLADKRDLKNSLKVALLAIEEKEVRLRGSTSPQ